MNTLDRFNLAARKSRDGQRARSLGFSVDMNRTGAAQSYAASIFRASEAQLFAQNPKEGGIRVAVNMDRLAIEGK
jgi:hypothetical protein